MRILVPLFLLVLSMSDLVAEPPKEPEPLSVRADRPGAVYARGETVSFVIQWQGDGEAVPNPARKVQWVISKDGMPPSREGEAALEGGRAVITGTLDEPGFLQCKVTFVENGATHTALAGAAIAPTEIAPSLPCPDDFDAFWADQKKQLAAVPMNARLTPLPPDDGAPAVEVFDVQADCVGAPVSGYYARPAGAAPGSCPARLYVDGAGVRDSHLDEAAPWARRGLISLAINAHGIPNGKPAEFYDEFNKGALKFYRIEGRESRDTWYFRGMFLRVLRALDFLAAQPEWDGRTLIIEGGSQGGAQAMVGAALDPRVTFYTAYVTAMCDHTGMLANRVAGWPKIIPVTDGVPDPAVLQASRYFDMVNFAPRIKAAGFFAVGFIDKVAPPTSVYAAYNQVSAPKEMVNVVDRGHGMDGNVLKPAILDAQLRHIAAQTAQKVDAEHGSPKGAK